jgi:predicted NAD/FAD-binding protein
MLRFPAQSFLQFFRNHGLIQITGGPQWRTVDGGGRAYVNRMLGAIHRVRIAQPVQRIQTGANGVSVETANGAEDFDDVVIATHADQALRVLDSPSTEESEILGAFGYARNEAWLHTDERLMPRRRRVWASWNHLTHERRDGKAPISVTYWMNRLQSLPTRDDVFVSLNPPEPPAGDRVYRHMTYDHPVLDRAAAAAQRRLTAIQGQRGLWFCGSYCGYGFHEDALASAVDVAHRLGVAPPWQIDREAAA